jgi:hypothetical protein
MSDVRYGDVKNAPRAALNYAIWRAMSEGRSEPPEAMRQGAVELAELHSDDQRALEDFGRRAWAFVSEQATIGTDPAHEASARARINAELPCLDAWTREVLWNVAYQRAMM